MYTLFAVTLWIGGLLIVLVMKKGEQWRQSAEAREADDEMRESTVPTAVATAIHTPRAISPAPKDLPS